MKPLNNIFCLCFGMSLLLFFSAGCGKKKAPEMPAHPVVAGQSYATNVWRYINTIGSCVSPAKVLIIPQVSGQIVKIHFIQGQEVKTGDLLYTIDPRPYQAALDKAFAQLGEDEAQLELNRLVLERNIPLAPGLYISPQDLDKYQLQVDMLEATVEADHAAVEAAQINLGYCFIASPVNGKTGVYIVNEGNVVEANDSKGLVSIQTISPIYAEFIVTEGEMMVVRRQMLQAKIQTEIMSIEDATIKESGDLFFLDNEVKPNAGTVTLRAVCQNQKQLLWPGQFINVRILLNEIKDAILAPYAAVQISESGTFLFVLKADSTVDIRPIKLGQRYGDDILVEAGIKAGEQVITGGQLMLRPGSRVKVVPPDAKDGKQ
ncbi:MAG: efflux RND transporter periplasmic adaptor subunit [Kiritimatiellia bacterium]|nr:efflux RND transporter periplasmic adaptor subunit [Kiritimatiellia bacterium]